MFEESVTSIPSIWTSMNSWFTPTVLFLFLNLMIGTIYVTSSLATQKPHQEDKQLQAQHHNQIARSPSVLQRLKSINFHSYRSPEPTTITLEKTQPFDNNNNNNSNSNSNSNSNTLFSFQQSPLEEYHQNQPFLSRSPSMLQRIKSTNLYNYFSQELPKYQETHASPSTSTTTITHFAPLQDLQQEQEQLQEQVEEEEEGEDQMQDQEQTIDEIYRKLKSNNNNKVGRSKSDSKPTSGEVPKKLPKKMKKSASAKSAFAHFQEEEVDIVESRRPATVREGKSGGHKMTEVDDAEVDAKADDFINRFKQQLKLQRIDSIIRYKDMVNRGSNAN